MNPNINNETLNRNRKFVGIHCVAHINLYIESAVTSSAPVFGLLVIFVCYRGRLWYIHGSSANTSDTIQDDAEQGEIPHGDDDEQHQAVVRRTRDWAVWLAIGWLFLIYTILCRTTFRSFACQEIGESASTSPSLSLTCPDSVLSRPLTLAKPCCFQTRMSPFTAPTTRSIAIPTLIRRTE